MSNDLGLRALARIQAMEALPLAKDYRRKWLDGATLPDRAVADEWMREQSGAPAGAHSFQVRELDRQLQADLQQEDAWGCAVTHEDGDDEFMEPLADRRPAMHALRALVRTLAHDFGREWLYEGPYYVLCGSVPMLRPVTPSYDIRPRVEQHRGAFLSEPFATEIILYCRPQATTSDVTHAYQAMQRLTARALSVGPRERIRPVTNERTAELAVFGARIATGEFSTWHAAMIAYSAEHPGDTTFRSAKDHGRFRRDVRRAYQAVTGLDLLWTPKRNGTLPAVSARVYSDDFEIANIRIQPARRARATTEGAHDE